MLSAYLSLAKPRILALSVVVSLASAVIAGQGSLAIETGVLLVLSGGLASAGAAFINNYFDRDIDAVMERTRHRPLPTGKVSPLTVLMVGVALVAAAVPLALLLNYLVASFVLGGVLIYSVIYTLWLKRRTSLNIVIGGLSGSSAVLAGWFAITSHISPVPLLIALIVFFWTPSHFWSLGLACRASYRMAGVPILPVLAGTKKTAACILLSTSLVVAASLVTYFVGPFHQLYLVSAIVLGALFLTVNVVLLQQPTRRLAWLNFKLSGAYLLGLFLTMALDIAAH